MLLGQQSFPPAIGKRYGLTYDSQKHQNRCIRRSRGTNTALPRPCSLCVLSETDYRGRISVSSSLTLVLFIVSVSPIARPSKPFRQGDPRAGGVGTRVGLRRLHNSLCGNWSLDAMPGPANNKSMNVKLASLPTPQRNSSAPTTNLGTLSTLSSVSR